MLNVVRVSYCDSTCHGKLPVDASWPPTILDNNRLACGERLDSPHCPWTSTTEKQTLFSYCL